MNRLKYALPVLCSLAAAAHFFRDRESIFLIASLLSIPLLFTGAKWAVRAVQLFYVLAAAEWINTIIGLTAWRMSAGLPWIRMVLILGTVTILTLLSAFVVRRQVSSEQ